MTCLGHLEDMPVGHAVYPGSPGAPNAGIPRKGEDLHCSVLVT